MQEERLVFGLNDFTYQILNIENILLYTFGVHVVEQHAS